MPRININDVHGHLRTIDSASALQHELDLFELRIEELIPSIESSNDTEAEQAMATYAKLQGALNAILSQLPAFNAQVAEERRAERKHLAEQLKRRRAERRGTRPQH